VSVPFLGTVDTVVRAKLELRTLCSTGFRIHVMGFSGGDDISHHLQMRSRALIILLYHNFGLCLKALWVLISKNCLASAMSPLFLVVDLFIM